jgi:EmrB/QacA subfamily drug resistance transporter
LRAPRRGTPSRWAVVTESPTSEIPRPSAQRWVVLGVVMMGTFMAILDSSIVNVALPHMMSTFGVSRDEIEWVATAFMLATAVAMPLVGWLSGRLGHKALYLGSLVLFTLGSLACATAWSYDALVAARIVQAIGGGAIQPVGMAIVADLFAPEERGRALGIWGTGIMIGPALGPTLGGYLTDWFNWRVIFSVNVPFAVVTLLFGMMVMSGGRGRRDRQAPFDLWGFVFLSMALVAGLLALSNGQQEGWTSSYIVTCFGLSLAGTVLFLAVESTVAYPLLPLSLFRHRNFSVSMVLALFRAVGLFGGVFLLPIFLESLVGYSTIQTGLWMMPGAAAVGLTMPIAGRLSDRFNPKGLVVAGTLITAFSLISYGRLDPRSSAAFIIVPQLVRGAGLALLMAPLMTAAINAVPKDQVATASSFLNVAQRVGGSFGIAVLNAFVTHSVAQHAVRLGDGMRPDSLEFARSAKEFSLAMARHAHGLGGGVPPGVLAAGQIHQRATVLAFDNAFVVAGFILLAGMPLAFLLKPAAR